MEMKDGGKKWSRTKKVMEVRRDMNQGKEIKRKI